MNFIKCVAALGLTLALVACGGGGGDPGTPLTGTSGTTTGTTTDPTTGTTTDPTTGTITTATAVLALSSGNNEISPAGSTAAQLTVKDANGLPIAGKLVTFTGDATLIKFSPLSGVVLTDVNGVASVQVSPVSFSSAGAGTLVAETKVGTSLVSASFDYQLAAANLGLQNLNLGVGTLAAFGNRPISAIATVNGVAATNTPVQVTFTASCGAVTPSVVTTDSTGTASTTYTASLATCAGTNVSITASAVSAASVSGTISVAASIATNVRFIVMPVAGSTLVSGPQLIYLKDSVGPTQAQVVFQTVDSNGNPLQNKKLRLTLSNTATGVHINTVENNGFVDLTTDSLGLVSTAVFSGTVPTSLNVKATLLNDLGNETAVFSNSNLLTVASGRPTQRSLSLSLEKFSIEAASVDGQTTEVTLSMADRQGNPVPPGTQVNFVTESGVMLPAVCFVPPVIPATETSPAIPVSSCTVSLKASGTRTANGRVSILAYVSGEEDFQDKNGDNVYDAGDGFDISKFDLGRATRDDNGQVLTGADNVYNFGEFQVPRDGAAPCIDGGVCPGDGVWGQADVRQQATVVFASSIAVVTPGSMTATVPFPGSDPLTNALTSVIFTIADENGNSMPTGSTVEISALDDGLTVPGYINAQCRSVGTTSYVVANSLAEFSETFYFDACVVGDRLSVKVKSPLGTVTERIFSVK